MTIPDWQLPPGVDRGLWDYLHSGDMVGGYDAQMAASPLALADVRFCEKVFTTPGRLLDLGCGTGLLCVHFAAKGYDCVGVDLSDAMLSQARANAAAAGVNVRWVTGNVVDPTPGVFDYAACLFSTLGMVRGDANRRHVLRNAATALRPGGRFVLHVHNRRFHWSWSVEWRALLGRPGAGDRTMPQAYGGAPLTLHHFTRRSAVRMVKAAGFRVTAVEPLGLGEDAPKWLPGLRAYGFLIAAERVT